MGMNVTIYPRGTDRVFEAPTSGAGAQHVSDVGELLKVKFSTRYGAGFGGEDLAQVTIKQFGGYIGGLFRPGDHYRITCGGGNCFEGEFSESLFVEPGVYALHAKGYAYNLYDYDSWYFEDVASPDDDISYPTDQLVGGDLTYTWFGYENAIRLGMPIAQVVGTIPTGPWGVDSFSDGLPKVGDVLTAHLTESGDRWQVRGRTLVIAADDLTPDWELTATDGMVGVADTEYATHVAVRYIRPTYNITGATTTGTTGITTASPIRASYVGAAVSGAGIPPNTKIASVFPGGFDMTAKSTATAAGVTIAISNGENLAYAVDAKGLASFDVRTITVDYRGLGPMTKARAEGIATELLDKVRGRFILTGSVTVTLESGLTSAQGGVVNDLWAVRAGDALRLTGVRTSQGPLLNGNGGHVFIIGQTDYDYDANTGQSLTITPLGSVGRNFAEIIKGVPLDAGSVVAGSA